MEGDKFPHKSHECQALDKDSSSTKTDEQGRMDATSHLDEYYAITENKELHK